MDSVFEIFGLFFKLLFAFGGIAVSTLMMAFCFGWIKEFTQNEGTATPWQFMGRYSCTTMEMLGHHFDDEGDIVLDRDPKTGVVTQGEKMHGCYHFMWKISGWIFYLAGFNKPIRYFDYSDDDGFGKDSYVFLSDKQREINLPEAMTKPGELISTKLKVIYKTKVVNPRKHLVVAPTDAMAQVDKNIAGIVRAYVASHTIDEVQASKSDGKNLWDEIYVDGSSAKREIDQLKQNWGVMIIESGITILDIGLQKDVHDALIARKIEQSKAVGVAQEVFGNFLANVAARRGYDTPGEAREMLEKTPEGKKLLDDLLVKANETVVKRKVAQSGGIVIEGIDQITATAMAILSKFGGNATPPVVPSVPPSDPNPPAPAPTPVPTPTTKPPKKEKSQEEKAEAFFKAKKVYPKWDPLKRTPN